MATEDVRELTGMGRAGKIKAAMEIEAATELEARRTSIRYTTHKDRIGRKILKKCHHFEKNKL